MDAWRLLIVSIFSVLIPSIIIQILLAVKFVSEERSTLYEEFLIVGFFFLLGWYLL